MPSSRTPQRETLTPTVAVFAAASGLPLREGFCSAVPVLLLALALPEKLPLAGMALKLNGLGVPSESLPAALYPHRV